MSQPTTSPRSSPRRKSTSQAERRENVDLDNVTIPTTFKEKAKKRAAFSMGGDGLKELVEGGFEIGRVGDDGLTPTKRARRSLKPRKSILKSFNSNTALEDSEDTVEFSGQNYAHTIAFSTSGLSRRVSFAPNAHVRMFEKDREGKATSFDPNQPFTLPPKIGTTPAPTSAPRSSINGLSAPSESTRRLSVARFVDVGGDADEVSMDMGSDSEEEGTGVQLGQRVSMNAPQPGIPAVVVSGEEDDGEMDMEETQVIYGGIIGGQPVADESFSTTGETSTDDEKTMDFTIAIGGLLPNSPPINASQTRARQSVGYSIPMSPRSAENRIHPGDPYEAEMSIEETVVIGGIIGADESISTASDASEREVERTMTFSFGDLRPPASPGMDMTVAGGSIISQPLSTSSLAPPRSPGMPRVVSPASKIARSPNALGPPPSSIPRFAQPTISSTKKTSPVKRNVFGPSPSPHQSTTPRKTSMSTAAEVAERLSFSATTPSAGKKRPREDDESQAPGSAKKPRPTPPQTPAEEIFGTGSADPTPRRSIGKPSRSLGPPSPGLSAAPPTPQSYGRNRDPRKSLGTPSRAFNTSGRSLAPPQSVERPGSYTPSKPYKSPRTLRQLRNEPVEDDDEVEVDQEQELEGEDWEQPPAVSLSVFLEMAGVQFNDNLPGISRRRSSVRRSLAASQSSGDREYALHEYAEAQIQDAFYNAYNWACSKLRADITSGHEELLEREQSCAEETPTVIKEYLSASDEDKALFESTFKDFKLNTQLKAQQAWYDWKKGLMEALRPNMQEYLDGQKEDQERLAVLETEVTALLPQLKARSAALEAELEREKQTAAQLAECDPGELQDLHMAIDEQAEQLKDFTKEYDDAKSKLDVLESKLGELNIKKRNCQSAISIAMSKCDQYTRSDVSRLKDEYMSIQHLHLWTVDRATLSSLVLIFDDELRLSLSCKNYIPHLPSANVDLLDKIGKRGSKYSQESTDAIFGLFSEAMRMLMRMKYTSLSLFVQRIGQLWTACQRLRSELGLLAFRHPTMFRQIEGSIVVGATMMLPSTRSKAILNFHLEPDLLFDWPMGLGNVQVSSSIIYGSADGETLSHTAAETMRSVTSAVYLGSFLQACVDASAQF